MVQDGTGRDEGSRKPVQDGTGRDQTVQDGTKTTELQNRGLQVRVLPGLLAPPFSIGWYGLTHEAHVSQTA